MKLRDALSAKEQYEVDKILDRPISDFEVKGGYKCPRCDEFFPGKRSFMSHRAHCNVVRYNDSEKKPAPKK